MSATIITAYTLRCNQRCIEQSIQTPFITAVLGPRRIGKSTLLANLTASLPKENKLYLNMDARAERNLIGDSFLKNIIEQKLIKKITPGNLIWVIIDEAQKHSPLFEQIKILYDEYKNQQAIKFILSGSSSLNLHQLSAESLAGRIQLFKLREFNLRESCSLKLEQDLPAVSMLENLIFNYNHAAILNNLDILNPYCQKLKETLLEELIYGGLPEVLSLQTKEERLQYLANYLQTYLEKDVLAAKTISDLNLYQNLMSIIADQTGSIRDDQKIISALGCSRDTMKKYRSLLEATLMYEDIYSYTNSIFKKLVKSPKGYLINNGLISFLSNLNDYQLLEKSGLIGRRFENWFLKELRVVLDRNPYNAEICYFRTTSGTEIDFIINLKQKVIPFEVTYSQTVDGKKLRNLRSFLQEEPKAEYGVIIYNGDFKYDAISKIYCLPAWAIN